MDVITNRDAATGKYTIMKHFVATDGVSISTRTAEHMCRGDINYLDMCGVNPHVMNKALELMKDKLGGCQVLHFTLTAEKHRTKVGCALNVLDGGMISSGVRWKHCSLNHLGCDR